MFNQDDFIVEEKEKNAKVYAILFNYYSLYKKNKELIVINSKLTI